VTEETVTVPQGPWLQ